MTSTNASPIKLVIKNDTLFRTDSVTPKALERGDYAAIDRSLMNDCRLSFAARALFVLLLCLGCDEHLSQKELARRTQHGPAKVGRLLKELEEAGWIRREVMTINRARGVRIDLLATDDWPAKSVPDRADPEESRFQTEPPSDRVDSEQNQPEEENPCAPTVTTPLIERDLKYNESKERKEGSASLSLVSEGVGLLKGSTSKPNWVRIAKLIEESFECDGDFVYGVLNPFVKNMTEGGKERKLLIFSEWLDHFRDERNKTRKMRGTKRNLAILWGEFEVQGCQPRLAEAAYA